MLNNEKIKVAVIVGWHPYDVVNFQKLFESIDGTECYIQHMEQFTSSDKERRQWYDVLVFYNMHSDTPETALSELGETKQGIFVLHHALLAYPQWSVWSEICGIDDRRFDYHLNQTVELQIADQSHSITEGISDFSLVDETYTMKNAGTDSKILITANHPKSMESIAWVRKYKNSPVFCFESGHDNSTFSNGNFRKIVKQAIVWLAKGE